jgi:7-cyano-7-deazaguanine synthase in queuosine biosynthesis
MSGGLDSMALLCVMLTELRNTNDTRTITAFTACKEDLSVSYAARNLQVIEQEFGVSITHINEIANNAMNIGMIGNSASMYVGQNYPTMTVYQGANNPPHPSFLTLHRATRYNTVLYNDKTFNSPFLFMHKPQILDIFYKLQLQHLIPYTHSCNVCDTETCGKCNSCVERAWGFSLLGKLDSETIPL